MSKLYETYWVFRDGYPVKRFITDNASTKARMLAEELARNYPGSVISCTLQRLWETEIFTLQPTINEPVKEKRDV